MTIRMLKVNALLIISILTLVSVDNVSYAQAVEGVLDPTMQVYRVRCQIDVDIDPNTGAESPKVQIQGKARAELLEGRSVSFSVVNLDRAMPPPPAVVSIFSLGSASADWDTFPDPASTAAVTVVDGDFVQPGELIEIFAQVTWEAVEGGVAQSFKQTVSETGICADKTSSQFRQDTKSVCTLKDYLRDKCKSGDILPDGSIQP